MRFWIHSGCLVIVLTSAVFAGAQSAPFRVKPSDVDTGVKDPGKELKDTRTPVFTPPHSTSSATSKNLQSIERQTAKANAPSQAKKTPAAFKEENEGPATSKINVKGSGQAKTSQSQTHVGTNAYKGRLKQKGPHSNNY